MGMELGVFMSVPVELPVLPRTRSAARTSPPSTPENPLSAEELRRNISWARSPGFREPRSPGLQGAGLGNSGFPFHPQQVPLFSPRLLRDL